MDITKIIHFMSNSMLMEFLEKNTCHNSDKIGNLIKLYVELVIKHPSKWKLSGADGIIYYFDQIFEIEALSAVHNLPENS